MTVKKRAHEITWDEIDMPICDWGGDSLFPSIDKERDQDCFDDAKYVISSPDMTFKLCEAHFNQIDKFLTDLGIYIHGRMY